MMTIAYLLWALVFLSIAVAMFWKKITSHAEEVLLQKCNALLELKRVKLPNGAWQLICIVRNALQMKALNSAKNLRYSLKETGREEVEISESDVAEMVEQELLSQSEANSLMQGKIVYRLITR
ncbi:MAG: hypothetical protein IJ760_07055 [Bacteroidales bacterium]|nr:hypothetical protein [Bacteroidales bacterium]